MMNYCKNVKNIAVTTNIYPLRPLCNGITTTTASDFNPIRYIGQ